MPLEFRPQKRKMYTTNNQVANGVWLLNSARDIIFFSSGRGKSNPIILNFPLKWNIKF